MVGMLGVQIMSEIFAQWGFFFYFPGEGTGRTVYVTSALAGLIFATGRVFDAITDPLIGAWSDRTPHTPGRWRLIRLRGRRRPFIVAGALLMTCTAILFWYPPIAETSWVNFVYGTAIMCLHWLFFTLAMVPLNALGPEIARTAQARVRLGQWQAAGMIVGLAIAVIVPGELSVLLDPARNAPAQGVELAAEPALPGMPEAGASAEEPMEDAPPAASPVGMQRTTAVLALAGMLCFLAPAFFIRERESSRVHAVTTPPLTEAFEALKNPPFRFYLAAFFLFMIGYLASQRVLPIWAVVALDGDESTITALMGPFILLSLITALGITPILSRYFSAKWLLFIGFAIIATGLPMMLPISLLPIDASAKTTIAAILFAYCGIGQGLQYVVTIPLLGQAIDYDERLSGERREAIYNAWSTVTIKAGQTLSVLLAGAVMSALGDSVESPYGIYAIGPASGLFAVLGLVVVWFYPEVTPTADAPADASLQTPAREAGPR